MDDMFEDDDWDFGPTVSMSAADRIRLHRSPDRTVVADRMTRVNAAYIGSHLDGRIDEEFNIIFDAIVDAEEAYSGGPGRLVGRRAEGRALSVVGKSGTGKSRLIRRVLTRRPELAGFGTPECMAISLNVTSPCTPRLIGQGILEAAGYVSNRELRENEAWDLVRHHLKQADIRIVHLDEFQHAATINDKAIVQRIRDSIKVLMAPENGIFFILSGLPGIEDFLSGDTQFQRRCRVLKLELLDDAKDLDRVIEAIGAFAKIGGLNADRLKNEDFAARLAHAVQRRFGIVAEFIQDAVRVALKEGSEELLRKHFANVLDQRTGVPRSQNVFAIKEGWRQISHPHSVDVEVIPNRTGSNNPIKNFRNT